MFTVEGYVAGGNGSQYYYDVQVGGPGAGVTGSPHVLGLLDIYEGEPVTAPPVGPTLTLDFNDPASVLAALYAHTDVRKVEGDVPAPFSTRRPGATD
ncbi:hypothetical protein [Actinomadura yumaensis]|uniref:CHRD domain-containing protein n=1 Tax=Actinomadura yumaensis TaxID=111807 RepID=A0ABW2CPF7_9ACTN